MAFRYLPSCAFLSILFFVTLVSGMQEYAAVSPNGKIEIKVIVGDDLKYGVWFHGIELVKPSTISMALDKGRMLGRDPRVKKIERRTIQEEIIPVVRQKRAVVNNHCEELALHCSGDYSVIFRAYDDGVAYRFVTRLKGSIKIIDEQMNVVFNNDHSILFPEEPDFFSHQERIYQYLHLRDVTPTRQCITPALVEVKDGPKVLISESDLDDYPGLWLSGGTEEYSLQGRFPHYVLKDSARNDRDVPAVERTDYLASTKGTKSFPWRVLLIAEKDGDLIESDLIFRLGAPLALKDAHWIKPGKVAWDWWNANNLYGVDFRAGLNTASYKHYIDFASEYGLEYIILDEGWYKLGDLMTVNPDIDMDDLLRYARGKGVGVILWMSWKTLYDQLVPALDLFASWGIPGLKVDFMQRDDQWMVNFYRLIAEEAAKRHMLVDFHGAYKPTGMERTFPNVITREGVQGMEHSKWSANTSPEHDLRIIFTRMAAGPMDYTPGSMLNDTESQFKPIFDLPHSQGTRCHQLAMYVVFESPLQMLADSPSNYRLWPECARFIAGVPTVWDETRVLDARVGEYVILARRSGDDWYAAAMTDWTARGMDLDLSFLGEGTFTAEIFQDGMNAARCAMDYRRVEERVEKSGLIHLKLASGGGWAARIKKNK